MAARAMANRIEIFGTVSAETMSELAALAVRQGVTLSEGGQRCIEVGDLLKAASAAQRNERPFVLYCAHGKDNYVRIESLLKASNVPYQVIAPFRSECGEFMARLFDGVTEFLHAKPMERGLRFKVVPAPGVASAVPCALQAA